ncbi:GFA family protein [Defluviimonas sp. WL0024]|uniref:GFA family protein n=2 Tax=Albidovulum TaxID=205889 RepID=A0ABT3J5T6_9RHOB|nr:MULTISPECIES: GFA family protein [Defluviimonas]MCU9849623.1 GFA family protein [Defluviimonas sp. WL0024]MCW3783044.1 GFA family protein [Defluviimonas salinarum]
MHGRCTCGKVRYRLTDRPLFIHACHCTWCQRETGGPHAVNAMIESDRVVLLEGAPVEVITPSNSGKGQTVLRCPDCHVALWSHYGGERRVSFVRVGTLEDPAACPPDIHIFTSTKMPWYALPEGVPAVPEYYDWKERWPETAQARRRALLAR